MGRWTARPPGNWVERANCKNERMWYSAFNVDGNPLLDADDLAMQEHGLALCRGCSVLLECRRWALSEPDPATDMIAGGMTPHQRLLRRLRK